jgi:integrase
MEDNDHIAKSPLNPRKMPKIYSIPSPRRAIAHEHYLRLLAAAKKLERNWQWFEAIVIGWNTGLRIQDVSNLKWEQVDLANDVITITPQKTRRFNKSLTIPIEPELRGVLAGMNRVNQFVLPTLAYHGMFYKGSAAYSASRYHLAKIFNDAKMPPGYSFHSLRHGIVTRMINNGVDAIIISSITGQTLEVIQGYAHVSIEAKKNALERARPIPQTQPQTIAA